MAVDIVASRMKGQVGYGDTSDTTPSSIRKGETIKRSAISQSIISADGSVSANAGDWQTRPVSAEQKVPTTPTMRSRNGEGGTIPSVTNRPKK
jgi:hypothetical protein